MRRTGARDQVIVEMDPQEEGLEPCRTCGHSQRNHEGAAHSCARSLCACARYDRASSAA
jgi:hypothetical protein